MTEKLTFFRQKIKNDNKMQYIIYCITFVILFIPNIFTLIFAADLQGNLVMSASYLLLSLVVWLFPLLFLNIKNYFRLGILFVFLAPIEIGFVTTTGLPVNIGFMETIFNTNFQEAKEQLVSNIPFLIFYIVLIMVYCYLLTLIQKKSLTVKWKVGLLLTFLILNLGLFYNMFSILKTFIPQHKKLDVAFENTTKKYHKIFPANMIINTVYALKTNSKNKKFEKEIENFKFNGKQNSKNSESEIYILVIGETARKHNFQLYGYDRKTNPELEKIENLVPYSEVSSSGTLTLISLPQIITRANPEQFDLQFNEKTILDLFHEAGFYTSYIGSQNISTSLVQRLKSVVDYSYFAKSDVSSAQVYDGDILKNVQEVLNDKKNNKKFIIIHTLGSHFRYSNRYPPEFEKFKPTIPTSGYNNMGLKYKQELINSYDNSIIYTDYFLSSLIKEVNKTRSVSGLIYLSDHGENLYDDNKTAFHGGEKPTRFEYEIPYLVWYSQQYEKLYPEKVTALVNNKNKKTSATTTFYSLSDMANISYTNSEKERFKSIFNPQFKEHLQRKLLNSKKEVININ